MANVFRPASLVIETDLDRSAVNDEVIVHPAAHNPAASRIILHETLHYWQQLSCSFLVRLAAEDLARLERYESDGTLLGPGPQRREYMRRYDEYGFSAFDLQEALARCWDVHILGPPLLLSLEREDPRRRWSPDFEACYVKLDRQGRLKGPDGSGYSGDSYDLAMLAAAGSYAKPYLMLLPRLGSVTAGGAFPLLAHIALHTPQPVLFFVRLLEFAAPLFDAVNAPTDQIEDFWKASFFPVTRIAIKLAEALGLAIDFMPLLSDEIDGALSRSKPHEWARQRLHIALNVLAHRDTVREQADRIGQTPLDTAVMELMLRLATPGVHRAFLAGWLSPPVVQFADGKRELLGETHRRMALPANSEAEQRMSAELVGIVDEAMACDARWLAFVRAGLRQGFSTRPPTPPDYESAVFDAARAIARLGMERNPILVLWLMQLLDQTIEDPHPLGGRDAWNRFVRATLIGQTTRATDIDHVCAMLILQLGRREGLSQYDAETGITWEWAGSPLDIALAAELCARAAEAALFDPERASLCRAIELEALKFDGMAQMLKLSPVAKRVISALAERIGRLQAAEGGESARASVRELMRKYAIVGESEQSLPI